MDKRTFAAAGDKMALPDFIRVHSTFALNRSACRGRRRSRLMRFASR